MKESFVASSGTFNNTVRGRILSDLFINTSAERLASVCLSSESFGLFFFLEMFDHKHHHYSPVKNFEKYSRLGVLCDILVDLKMKTWQRA